MKQARGCRCSGGVDCAKPGADAQNGPKERFCSSCVLLA